MALPSHVTPRGLCMRSKEGAAKHGPPRSSSIKLTAAFAVVGLAMHLALRYSDAFTSTFHAAPALPMPPLPWPRSLPHCLVSLAPRRQTALAPVQAPLVTPRLQAPRKQEAWPIASRDYRLRDYQQEAAAAVLQRLRERRPYTLLNLPAGGGKTRVAMAVALQAASQGFVLWVAKDWELLMQAEWVLRNLTTGDATSLRIGEGGSVLGHLQQLLPPLRPARGGGLRVAFTTLQSFHSRRGGLGALAPSLVVWDEVHWAETTKMGRALLGWAGQRDAPLLGLTATPRPVGSSNFNEGYSISILELVRRGWLAEPQVTSVKTGFHWDPEVVLGEFSPSSLRELNDARRNRVVVQHYVQNRAQYRKTLVFTSNIAHADALGELFRAQGVPTLVLHSQKERKQVALDLRTFRDAEGPVVLVNVAMLTHGVDVPDISEVFLCRPTQSERLYLQMVGRGARLSGNKTSFLVVEFADSLRGMHHLLFNGSHHFHRLPEASSHRQQSWWTWASQRHAPMRDPSGTGGSEGRVRGGHGERGVRRGGAPRRGALGGVGDGCLLRAHASAADPESRCWNSTRVG
eukprot:CAMPEP_0179110292 /NCGR_PEP_ID=MMETSP0796-20121207/51467_1 /TAXON_ID=73915 /ORGANISM="Pyrodinium bahamense, Strain pbaha01" /LENGTH=572 /DNA_ID=CAMNT_0020808423 /DNA_START=12 /DNA_END=1731 /DNA_ORIENTATION=-